MLSTRVPEATGLSKAINVKMFFFKLAEVIETYQFSSHQIWNVDETGVTTVQKPHSIIAEEGVKQVF